MAAVLAAGALVCGWVPAAHAVPRVTIAVLPTDTTIDDLARIPSLSPGVMSTGIGDVPAEQTYLDISQGNRLASSLYDDALPAMTVGGPTAANWQRIVDRADGAPGDVVPGLLGSILFAGDVGAYAHPWLIDPALIIVERRGQVFRRLASDGVTVRGASPGDVRRWASRTRGDDLVIAFAGPPPDGGRLVPIGIAGRGFDGDLTSDSTRTDGYVLSTDIAPTILNRYGLTVPGAMAGEPIRTEGSNDAGAVRELAERMRAIPDRRTAVVVGSLSACMLIALLAAVARPGLRRVAAAWLALAFAYMPLMLLAGAAVESGAVAEGLLVGLGAAALAAVTLVLVRGWLALATACAITVIAYAIDVVTGSELTKLSLLGPNPIFGVRFYGIGNELEALFAVMVPVGVGAAVTTWRRSGKTGNEGGAAAAFIGVGALAAVVFGIGRFGADVGAAIVLPVGAAVSVAAMPRRDLVDFSGQRPENSTILSSRRLIATAVAVLLAVVATIATLSMLVLVDLISGGNSHLSRSVLDAGGANDLADIVQRRLELSAHDFAQAARNPLFWLVIAGICVCLARWRRIDAWLRPAPLLRAGFLGACAAVAAGVLVNDSGATFLVLGSLALGATLSFAWAQAGTDP